MLLARGLLLGNADVVAAGSHRTNTLHLPQAIRQRTAAHSTCITPKPHHHLHHSKTPSPFLSHSTRRMLSPPTFPRAAFLTRRLAMLRGVRFGVEDPAHEAHSHLYDRSEASRSALPPARPGPQPELGLEPRHDRTVPAARQ